MYCRNCGKELPDDARFCTGCGCSLDAVPDRPWSARYDSGRGAGRPPSYLALAIVVTILCCVPFGIVGIVYSSKVESCLGTGDLDGAWEYSRKARNWSVAGLVLSVLFWIVYVVLIIIGFACTPWWGGEAFYARCMF